MDARDMTYISATGESVWPSVYMWPGYTRAKERAGRERGGGGGSCIFSIVPLRTYHQDVI